MNNSIFHIILAAGFSVSAIEQEILFRALIAPVNGKSRVIGFGFL